ncbi:hypothetical protein ACFYYR_28650 [Streptomyces sp. NPDC001922]|uniref:RICIN domain-containing protein n=1 Tax=Streptomyces sp. NPDC001922 TaxID=3364624 RepID=UPI0036893E04
MKKRLFGIIAAAAVAAPALLCAGSAQAASGVPVTWKNKGTNRCLDHISGSVAMGQCDFGYQTWYEKKQSDGTYTLNDGDKCLEQSHGGVRLAGCNGSSNQRWYEKKLSNGWRLTSKATKRTLGTNSSHGLYVGIDTGGKLQRWS